jgi:transposase
MAAEPGKGVSTPNGGHAVARIAAASAQVPPRRAPNADPIFEWLRDRRFAPAAAVEEKPAFLPVEVREDDAPAIPMASPAGGPRGRVRIVLATGHRTTVEGPFDGDAAAQLLRVPVRP